MRVCAGTHKGLIRSRNEDSYGATGLVPSRVDGTVVATDLAHLPGLSVVADGLGGHPSGDVASAFAVESLLTAGPADAAGLVAAVHAANRALVDHMSAVPTTRGMGTTVAAVLILREGLAVVNVGDSPVLELVGDRLIQLTVDDVAPLGGFTSGPSSALTQSLGGGQSTREITPHVYEDRLSGARRLLLCSDGLTSFVRRELIVDALRNDDPRRAVETLLTLALESGGGDNVTCLVVDRG